MGRISKLIIFDTDQRVALDILETHCPHLLDTYTTQSGTVVYRINVGPYFNDTAIFHY